MEDHDAIDLMVRSGGTVVGTLVDDDDRPVSGAVIRATALVDGTVVRAVDGTDSTETDAAGRFRMVVPTGVIVFEIDHPQFAGLAPWSKRYTKQYTPFPMALTR